MKNLCLPYKFAKSQTAHYSFIMFSHDKFKKSLPQELKFVNINLQSVKIDGFKFLCKLILTFFH